MDREKVIRGLEICKSTDKTCSDCPYNGEVCTTSLCDDVLSLLKEHEAVEPSTRYGYDFFICPVCKNALFEGQKFCHECGQEMKRV